MEAWTAKAQPSLDPARTTASTERRRMPSSSTASTSRSSRWSRPNGSSRIADLNCVEIAETTSTVSVRDSTTPAGPILTVGPAAFTSFVNWTSTAAE
ncbi:DUF397 domain-containing protein [Streptomyces canus]|uniref:DUF397 domain-containing protein n=1 Tax=Streptomyces canus TaxID=58343 RepID=UPI0033BA579A